MRRTVLLAVAVLVSCAPRRVEPAKKPVAKPPPEVEAAPREAEPAPAAPVEAEAAPTVGPPVPEPEKRFVARGLGGGGGMFSPSSSPHDPDLMFVNSDMGCISRSEDGGRSWQVLDQRVVPSNTRCNPLFHPTDPDVVYHAAGRMGLKVSRDRGQTWERLVEDPPWGGDGILHLGIDRGTPERMFVGTGKGAFVSLDAGTSWKQCEGVEGAVGGVFVDFASPEDARVCVAGTGAGVYRSDDGGSTWRKLEGAPGGVRGLAGGRSGEKAALFATTANAVHRSLDGGESWKAVTPPDAAGKEFRFVGVAETDADVAYVTDRGKSWTVWKTEDCGRTWKMSFRGPAQYGYPDPNVELGWLSLDTNWGWGGSAIGFGVNKAHPDVAMYTNTGELFITRDGGRTWKWGCSERVEGGPPARGQRWRSTGLEVTTCWQVGFDPNDDQRVVICYTDIGFALSEDAGESWKHSPRGSPWGNTFYKIIFDPEVKGRAYAVACGVHDIPGWRYTGADIPGRGSGGIVVTDDGCHTWRSISEGLPKTACVSMELDPKSPPESRTLYCSMYGEGVFKSADGGKSWEKKSAGLGVGENMHVYALHLHENGDLYCSITGRRPEDLVFDPPGGLFRSSDGAESWESLTKDVEIYWPAEFAVHPEDPDVIYLCSSDVPQLSTGGVWRTKDGGGTWEQMLDKTDFPQEYLGYCHVFAPYFHPEDANTIYLSTWTHGLWISRDGGESWKEIKAVPSLSINRVTVDPRDPETLWVTTYGEGVWKGPAFW